MEMFLEKFKIPYIFYAVFVIRISRCYAYTIYYSDIDGALPQHEELRRPREDEDANNTSNAASERSNLDELCLDPGCIHTASMILQNLDQNTEPCDDFYQFACGQFRKKFIPDDKSGLSMFSVIADELQEQLRMIVSEPIKGSDIQPILNAKNMYKLCMNEYGMSYSAPATSFDEAKGERSDVISIVSQDEQLIPEREHIERQQREDLDEKLESLKAELEQCREAVTYSDAKIAQLTEELHLSRIAMANEKDKMAKQILLLTRTLNDHKASVKSLTEERDVKDITIANLKGTLSKTDASNACRAVTIKSLKQEIQLLKKDLVEAATSESLLQKGNKELLVENGKLKSTMDGLKNQLSMLQESNAEWGTIINKQIELLKKEGEDNHFQCSVQASRKLGTLKASYDHRLQLLLKKLFRADRKTKQLYRTIERIVKGLHFHKYTHDLEKLIGSDFDMEGAGDRKGVVLDLGDWLDTCHDLAFKKNFSSELSAFVLNLLESENQE